MTWTDTIFHSDIFLTFGPRLALHHEGEMNVSFQSRHKQTICGFRRWSPCTTSLRCMSQLLALRVNSDLCLEWSLLEAQRTLVGTGAEWARYATDTSNGHAGRRACVGKASKDRRSTYTNDIPSRPTGSNRHRP